MKNLVLDIDQVVSPFMSPKDITRFVAQNVFTREMGNIIGNDDNNVFVCDGRIHDNKSAMIIVRDNDKVIDIKFYVPGHNMRDFNFTVLPEDATFQKLARYVDYYVNDGRLYL